MEFDIYKCTVYTETCRLIHNLNRGKQNKVKMTSFDRKALNEQARANALALLEMMEFPCKDRKAYERLNAYFSQEVMKSNRIMEITCRTIRQWDLVPILVEARKSALGEYALNPYNPRKANQEASFQRWLDEMLLRFKQEKPEIKKAEGWFIK